MDAFDVSEAGIAKLKRLADKAGITVNAWVQDLTKFHFKRTYDVILSNGVLHLVTREQWQEFIIKMKAATNPGGINMIGIFTDQLPAAPDMAAVTKGLFHEGDLDNLYADWETLNSDNYRFEDEHPGGIRHRHAAAHIAAKKPSLFS